LLHAIQILFIFGDLVGQDPEREQERLLLSPVSVLVLLFELGDNDLYVLVEILGELLFARLFDIGQVFDEVLVGALYIERV